MVIDNAFIGILIIVITGMCAWIYIIWSNTREASKHTRQIYQQQELVKTDPEAHRLSQAMHLLRPTARLGFDYTIKCSGPGEAPCVPDWETGGEKPKQSELDDALARVTEIDSRGYAAMRRAEYPSVEDQLDAAYKARRGNNAEQLELDQRIEEIKNKYPKSDAEL